MAGRLAPRLVVGLGLGLLSGAAGAERFDLAAMPMPQPDDVILVNVRAGVTLVSLLERVIGDVRVADRDDNGLDAADIALQREVDQASARADAVSEVLQLDLNGDLVVTMEEAQRAARATDTRIARPSVFSKFDANRDG